LKLKQSKAKTKNKRNLPTKTHESLSKYNMLVMQIDHAATRHCMTKHAA